MSNIKISLGVDDRVLEFFNVRMVDWFKEKSSPKSIGIRGWFDKEITSASWQALIQQHAQVYHALIVAMQERNDKHQLEAEIELPRVYAELCRRIQVAEAERKAKPCCGQDVLLKEDSTRLPTGWLTTAKEDIHYLPLEQLLHLFANARICGRLKHKELEAEAFQTTILKELERRIESKPEPQTKKVKLFSNKFGPGVWQVHLTGTVLHAEIEADNEIKARRLVVDGLAALGLEAEFPEEEDGIKGEINEVSKPNVD